MVHTEGQIKLFTSRAIALSYARELLDIIYGITETEVVDDCYPTGYKSYEVRELNRDIQEYDLKYFWVAQTPIFIQ
jgi:predicted HTH domain antitoxin